MFDDSLETLFYDMQRELYNEWEGLFKCDTDSKFIACHRSCTGFNYHTPAVVDDSCNEGVLCLTILEKCLDAENEYPSTFWLECVRIFLAREFTFASNKKIESLFDSFIAFMLQFNNTYPMTLPSIFHSTREMHKAVTFFITRVETERECFFLHVMSTEILLKYDSEEVEPQIESHESPEAALL